MIRVDWVVGRLCRLFLPQEMKERIFEATILWRCACKYIVFLATESAGSLNPSSQETYLLVEGFPTSWSEVRQSSLAVLMGPLCWVVLDGSQHVSSLGAVTGPTACNLLGLRGSGAINLCPRFQAGDVNSDALRRRKG